MYRLDVINYCFSQRTLNEWNKYYWQVLGCNIVVGILINIMFKNVIENYLVRAGCT